MTAQTLYNNLQEGKITKDKFLYEVRRDPNLPMITKFNSFEDTIQILKNKSIISEERYKKENNPELPKVESLTIDQVSPYEYSKGINYELELTNISAGNNLPSREDMIKTQNKVLKNLTSDKYYYTKKCMSDEEKKLEKANLRPEELGKVKTAKNQLERNKVLKENLDQYYTQDFGGEECESCEREELDFDQLTPEQSQLISQIAEEWGLTNQDFEDDDIIEELEAELERRSGIEEAVAVKDKAGNVQYAKDDSEATNIMNAARAKGVQLTKQSV